MVPRDLHSVIDSPNMLDHQLLRYVESGRDATRPFWHLSYMHDKGNVAGLQMQPAAFVAPTNVGIVPPPTVPYS